MIHERSGAPATSPFPFATPEFSVDPSYQALYDEWAKRRDEKASYTLQDRLRATKESPRAMTRVYNMSITMMVLSLVMLILFRRIAAKRRELERRMTSHTTGTVLDIRQKMIGRRLVTYGTVEYLHGGVLRRDEFMFDPAKLHRPGDTVPVRPKIKGYVDNTLVKQRRFDLAQEFVDDLKPVRRQHLLRRPHRPGRRRHPQRDPTG